MKKVDLSGRGGCMYSITLSFRYSIKSFSGLILLDEAAVPVSRTQKFLEFFGKAFFAKTSNSFGCIVVNSSDSSKRTTSLPFLNLCLLSYGLFAINESKLLWVIRRCLSMSS